VMSLARQSFLVFLHKPKKPLTTWIRLCKRFLTRLPRFVFYLFVSSKFASCWLGRSAHFISPI
jgi:hypothetical protein